MSKLEVLHAIVELLQEQFKFDVDLYSKFGPDFPKQYLSENKINFDKF